uniref:Uncharacterized protein n=1 Tax=Romanomermis culicivorax TaxID=13658 RepID=A0A915JS37_ROMCU
MVLALCANGVDPSRVFLFYYGAIDPDLQCGSDFGHFDARATIDDLSSSLTKRNLFLGVSVVATSSLLYETASSNEVGDRRAKKDRFVDYQDSLEELTEESMIYGEAQDKILKYCAPDCNLDMLKRDLLDKKQEPDEAAAKFLKRQEPMMEIKLCGLHNCAMEKKENMLELECSAEYDRNATAKELEVFAQYPRMQPFHIGLTDYSTKWVEAEVIPDQFNNYNIWQAMPIVELETWFFATLSSGRPIQLSQQFFPWEVWKEW